MKNRKKNKIALIIGISGQDGSYLASFLLDKGYKVYGTSRDAELNHFFNLKKLNDLPSIIACLKKINPDEIYNLSGQSSVALSFDQPHETYKSIVEGTLNLLEAVKINNVKCRYYNACSSECFGDLGKIPADENTGFKPKSPYAIAKASAFWTSFIYRKSYKIFSSSGILFNHESPLRPNRFVTKKIIDAVVNISKGNKDVLELGALDIHRDWGWAPDYVEAMYLILQQENPSDFVICTGQTHSLREFVSEAFSLANLDYQNYTINLDLYARPTEIFYSAGNPKKAKEILGWTAKHSMKDVVKKLYKSELSNYK